MALPLTSVPSSFVAGDTFDVVLSFSDFRAPTWDAVLYFTAYGLNTITLTAADSGADHRFLLSGGSTAGWSSGTYDWTVRALSGGGGQTITAATGKITLLPDPSTATAATDPRSHARRTLDIIQALIEGRAVSGIENYSIDGRQISKIPFKDLMALRDRYAAIVASESGSGGRKNILFRFTCP